MRSLPPESDNSAPTEDLDVRTDFQSLQATTPLMIFVMVYTTVFFLLDVRYGYTEVHNLNIRFVALCFIVGIVALNRIIARDGSEESILYIVGLVGAMGMYTLATTGMYGVGAVSRNFMNSSPWLATGFNMLLVFAIWWATNRLMHECCVDENLSAGDVGLLTRAARRFQRAAARDPEAAKRRKTNRPIIETHIIEAYDPTAPRKPKPKPPPKPAAQRLGKRHPGVSVFYFSVPVMAIFAWGLRVVQQGGEGMVRAGKFYMGCYTVAALTLLMLTSLGSLRAYFRARRTPIPAALGWFWIGLGVLMIAMVLVGAAQLPKPSLPPMAHVGHHQTDYWSRGSKFELLVSAATPAQMLEESRLMDRVGQVVLACFALFLVYALLKGISSAAAALGRRRDLLPKRLRNFFEGLDKFLQRITRLPQLPKARRPLRISRHVATCVKFTNPLSRPDQPLSHADLIEHAYQALCALAHDLGVPREDAQTPYEFIEAFPDALKSLRPEAHELTGLYVRSAYSQAPIPPGIEDRIRKFWIQYERVRGRVIR